jgi:predicted TIM-barrel fold metal-dependent hydrolase
VYRDVDVATLETAGNTALPPKFSEAAARYFRADQELHPTIHEIAEYYSSRNMAAVVFAIDIESATGHPSLSNERIADEAAKYPDFLIPFASIDPPRGKQVPASYGV